MAIREDLVQQGVRFLQHPKVQNTPLSERLSFLEKKGLTPQEIARALKLNDEQTAARAAKAMASVTGAVGGERLKGRIGIVVGGNTGLGRFITVRLAKEGAKLIVLDSKSSADDTKSVTDEDSATSSVVVKQGDLHDWSFIDTSFAGVVKDHGRIDFVVNCVPSGSDKQRSLVDVDEKEWDDALGVSAKAVFLSCKRALQQLLTQDNGAVRGRIVNVASVYGGLIARPGRFTFGVSKSVVVHLTRQIAAEYASQGVICNAVAPGSIDDSVEPRDCVPPTSSQRIPAEASGHALDVANAVLFLVSDDTRYVHGVNLLVDGGIMAT
ncbi:hypothetical protein PINS_up010664 [Pythium insidiosum]|nr:hypothetical protein PINS_up010664 [Pythium insidiosum]